MESFLYEIGDQVSVKGSPLDWIVVNKKRNALDKSQKLYDLRCRTTTYEKNAKNIEEERIERRE